MRESTQCASVMKYLSLIPISSKPMSQVDTNHRRKAPGQRQGAHGESRLDCHARNGAREDTPSLDSSFPLAIGEAIQKPQFPDPDQFLGVVDEFFTSVLVNMIEYVFRNQIH
jgi:hypothetical protein